MHTSVKLVKSAGGTGKILLVDDEPAVLNMLKQLLERGGYEVVACGCSTDALELFQRDSCFDLVITDQTMPGLTGSQLAGRLLTIKPEIPIILCTGYSETIDSAKAGLLGIRKFLMKPVIGQVLLSNVHSVLQNHI